LRQSNSSEDHAQQDQTLLVVRNNQISSIDELLTEVTKRYRRIKEHALTCQCCREVLEEH
jgi:hypothetical protein